MSAAQSLLNTRLPPLANVADSLCANCAYAQHLVDTYIFSVRGPRAQLLYREVTVTICFY
jgi:hypothetical protein